MPTSAQTVSLAPLDWAILALFVAAILALGFSARLRDNSILQFLAAGRSLTLPFFVATLVSTWYGGILGVAEAVSYYGFGAWLLLGIPYYAFALIYAFVFAGKVRGAEQLSIPERLELKWGKGVGLLGAALIFLLAVPAAHVLMLGILVQSVTGWHLAYAVVVATAIGTLFLYKGGLLADVRVGAIAFLMMYIGFAVILGWCAWHYPPAQTFAHIENRSLLSFTGGQGPLVIVSFFILGAWTMVDPGFHQRVASSESPRVGRNGVLVSVLFWFLFDMLSMGTAMYALALLPQMPKEPLLIYPLFGNQILPPGLKAVFFCGMLGTILSAMVGYSLVSGTTIGREMVARVATGMKDSQVTNWSRVGVALACVVAIVLALNISSVVNLWYQWGGCVIGALLVPVCLAYLREVRTRISGGWILASMALAFVVSFSWLIFGYRTNNKDLNVACIRIDRSWRLALPETADKLKVSGPDRIDLGIGTLVPGLVISVGVLAVGALAGRRNASHD